LEGKKDQKIRGGGSREELKTVAMKSWDGNGLERGKKRRRKEFLDFQKARKRAFPARAENKREKKKSDSGEEKQHNTNGVLGRGGRNQRWGKKRVGKRVNESFFPVETRLADKRNSFSMEDPDAKQGKKIWGGKKNRQRYPAKVVLSGGKNLPTGGFCSTWQKERSL